MTTDNLVVNSEDIIQAIRDRDASTSSNAYAFAFGWAWVAMSKQARQEMYDYFVKEDPKTEN